MPEESLRGIFDADADLYDQARPGYPDELFDDLAELAAIGPGARVAEIGPGTGQATLALAAAGARVVAVELGASLAQKLRRKTAGLPVEVVVGGFEDWVLPSEPFDTVAAFTSWHWLTPGIRVDRADAALRPGGALATVTTTHVLGGTAQFFADVQDCYLRWDPDTPTGVRLLPADEIPPTTDEVDTSERFEPAVRRRYQQDIAYSTRTYLDVLRTYSGHRALAPDRRAALLGCIGELLDTRYDGSITKRYLYELRVSRRRPAP